MCYYKNRFVEGVGSPHSFSLHILLTIRSKFQAPSRFTGAFGKKTLPGQVQNLARERIADVVERLGTPVAESLGYELVEVEYKKEGPDWVLRLSIDCPAGVGTDECQRFSEAFDEVLERHDPIPGSYLLEVCSPGLERPLKKERDFERFAGNTVEIKLREPVEGRKVYRGKLLGLIMENGCHLVRLETDESKTVMIPREKITKAHLTLEIFGGAGGRKKK